MILDNALHPDKAGQHLLYVLFTAALDHRFEAGQAEAFGIWTLCYVQYCQRENVAADAPHLPGFLAMLRDHPRISEEDRNRALDAVMFALFDVFDGKIDAGAAGEMVRQESSNAAQPDPSSGSSTSDASARAPSEASAPRALNAASPETESGGRLLTRLLFHTDLKLSEAVRLTAGDVDVSRALLRVGPTGETRIIPLPEHLRAEVSHQARSLLASNKSVRAPLFPAAYDKYVTSSPDGEEKKAATRVMQTLFLT
jgi:integrase